jgi:hypothetical protein
MAGNILEGEAIIRVDLDKTYSRNFNELEVGNDQSKMDNVPATSHAYELVPLANAG